ncbi:MAG: glutamate mutase L [Deltaproteobacteria bacterium]|nr:glutamate mutase L [Deltaproteobacteria bacterium]MCX7952703.1 glutamate mutase L [Deltaproteobacteria bacterium]
MVGDNSFNDILITDFGSTTTKARYFRKLERWKLFAVGEAPTSVEEPFCDVTIGLYEALEQIQRRVDKKLVSDKHVCVDLFLSTSSAGGGLQVVVLAPTYGISGQRAEKAAMLAGAILLKTICLDENKSDIEAIKNISDLKPDIVIVVGSFDGSQVTYSEKFAEILLTANPEPRFKMQKKMPVILAGSSIANVKAENILKEKFFCFAVENVSPSRFTENLSPLIFSIHEIFVSHVMANAPGYQSLLNLLSHEPEPTPIAAGRMVQFLAREFGRSCLCVDIGGATTDIFSCDENGDSFVRTVCANYGMSYSIPNVLKDAKNAGILEITQNDESRLFDKMLRPGTLPFTPEQLKLEHLLAKVALYMSLERHKFFCKDLYREPELVIGSGGVISHCPTIQQASEILIDGFQLSGICELVADNLFLLPHLGILSNYMPPVAKSLFIEDCVRPLCVLVRPESCLWLSKFFKKKFGKVIVNEKFEFEILVGKRLFVVLPEDVRHVKIDPVFGAEFKLIEKKMSLNGFRVVCIDGTPIRKKFFSDNVF